MAGITLEELSGYLSGGHEIVFSYQDGTYSPEPDKEGEASYVTLWKCGDDAACLARCKVHAADKGSAIRRLLRVPCFDGKSFMEVEGDVKVETVY